MGIADLGAGPSRLTPGRARRQPAIVTGAPGLADGTPRRLETSGAPVADVIDDLDRQVPGMRNRLLDAGPVIRAHINVFVAGRQAALDTPVPPGAAVHVIPAVSGG